MLEIRYELRLQEFQIQFHISATDSAVSLLHKGWDGSRSSYLTLVHLSCILNAAGSQAEESHVAQILTPAGTNRIELTITFSRRHLGMTLVS